MHHAIAKQVETGHSAQGSHDFGTVTVRTCQPNRPNPESALFGSGKCGSVSWLLDALAVADGEIIRS